MSTFASVSSINYTAVVEELAQMREDVLQQRDIHHYEWVNICGRNILVLVLQGPSYGLCKKTQAWLEYYGVPTEVAERLVDAAAEEIDKEVREENRKELLAGVEAEFGLFTDPYDIFVQPGTSLRADSPEYYTERWDAIVA